MPNDCWNNITITVEDEDTLNLLFNTEIKPLIDIENDNDNDNERKGFITIKTRGKKGLYFTLWSSWYPDFLWLQSLITKYQTCWVKNEWSEEGGTAGVWVGTYSEDKDNLNIKSLEWDDLSIEGQYYYFR